MTPKVCPMFRQTISLWLVPPERDENGRYVRGTGVRNPESLAWLSARYRAALATIPRCGAASRGGKPCGQLVKPGGRCRIHSGSGGRAVQRRRAAARLKTVHSIGYTERRAARALHEKHWKAGDHWFGAPLIELPEDLIAHLETITGLSRDHIAPSILNWAGWQWQQLVRERRATRLSGGQVGLEAALELFSRELPRRIAEAGPKPAQPDLPERPVWMDWVEPSP